LNEAIKNKVSIALDEESLSEQNNCQRRMIARQYINMILKEHLNTLEKSTDK